MTDLNSELLNALIDTVLPGGEGFPAGSRVGIADWLAARESRFGPALAEIIAQLPPRFAALRPEARDAMVARSEETTPAAFHLLVTGLYSAYYSAPATRAVIAEKTGYSAGPPQPQGYVMEPFDPSAVLVPAARAASWRKA